MLLCSEVLLVSMQLFCVKSGQNLSVLCAYQECLRASKSLFLKTI